MPVQVSADEFENLVGDALDRIPTELADAMDNVVILIDGHNAEEPTLLGLYEGIALTERDTTYGFALPDTITVYREPLLAICHNREELVEQVAVTVVHEIAHHFGIDDDWLHEHGWG